MLEGVFDFIKTPFSPLFTKVVLHEKPSQRLSWDPHGTEGWYLGPALEYYRCYHVFVNKSKAERVTDTIEFFPQKVPMIYTTPTDVAIQSTAEIIRLLQQPDAIQISKVGTKKIDAIKQLAAIFKKPRPDKVSTPVSDPRVPDNVTAAPSTRVLNEASSSQRVAAHPKHRYPTQKNMGLPHQANSGINIPIH